MKFWPFARKEEPVPVRKAPPLTRRSYAAAGSKLTFADFKGSKGSADYELLNGLAKVREKSRSLARNSGTMKRYLWLLKVNVVGKSGFSYRCRVRKADGKTLDANLNRSVEWAYWQWAKRPTTCGKMTMRALEKLVVESWARDGEAFVEIVTNSRYRDGFALNPLEADLIDETLNGVNSTTGNQIRMGVEVDEQNAPLAYHVLVQHPGDPGWYHNRKNPNRRHRRVPADRMIHLYEILRAGQTRGEPTAAAAILGVKMLDGYREAEVTNRRVAASTMGFFKRMLPGAGQIEALADRRVEGDDGEPEFQVDLTPGTFVTLPDGYEHQTFDVKGSTTDYADFEAQVKRDIAMGLNISNMSLGMETNGVSYSAGRTIIQEDRDFYSTVQQFVIEGFSDVVIQKWILMHSIQIDSVIPPSKITKVQDYSSLAGRGWDWVDPGKDVSSNAEALRTRQTSLSRIAAQRGIDFADLIEEIKDDEEMLKAQGLTLTFTDGKQAEEPAVQEGGQGDGKAIQGE